MTLAPVTRWMDSRALAAPVRRWWHRSREFRPIFIAGAAGAGTSLLAYSLAQRFEHGVLIREAAREQPPGSLLYVDKIDTFPSLAAYEHAIRPDPAWTPEAGRDALLGLRGKQGGRSLIEFHAGDSLAIPLDPAHGRDLDTPEDAERLRASDVACRTRDLLRTFAAEPARA